MFPVQNGLICWLDAMDGKAGDTLLKDRTSYGHNLIVENFQQGYGFTRTSIKVKQSKFNTSNNNALYIANGGFKTSCKSFCICIERHNTNQPWYIFDGRGLDGQGLSTNHCFNGNTGSSYDNSKTRRDGVLTYNNSNLDINKKTFLYFELKEAELFTLSILMRCSKNENTEGEFYSLYAYNRALTEEEILQNMEYENNKISYVNETNLPKIVDKLSNASNIKIVNNKYGNRVQTVVDKIVEKADNVTKAVNQEVINDGYSFKVGTGNVDVSTDVEDGFGEVGVKGVTYQNILGTRITTSNGVEKSNNIITFNKVAQTNCAASFLDSLAQVDKTYTLIFDILENTIENPANGNIGKINIVSYNSGNYFIKYKETGHIKVLLKQPATSTGKPYVELYNSTSGKFVMTTPILLEGNHLDNPSIPSKISNIVGVGDKSKNLFNIANSTINKYLQGNIGSWYGTYGESSVSDISDYIPVVANKTYVFSYDFKELLGTGERAYCFYNKNKELITSNKNTLYSSTSKKLILTPSIDGYVRICYDKSCLNIQIEEGSTVTSYEPYYDGHKIEILSCGKNLINIKDMPLGSLENSGKVVMSPTSAYKVTPNFIKIEPTRKVCFYYEYNENDTSTPQHNMIAYYDENFSYLGAIYDRPPKGAIVIPHTKAKYIRLRVRKETVKLSLVFSSDIVYIPYIEDKTQILLDEPLMRLPSGVCDEITRDGKLIRRVGKVVLDGREGWGSPAAQNDLYVSFHHLKAGSKPQSRTISDKFPYKNVDLNCESMRCGGAGDNGTFVINIFKSRLSEITNVAFKQWLSENPVTVYYELATPIITELPAPYLRIFKDGHLTFNTLVAPESNHVVQLNKSGQIQNAIKESQSLDNRINVLENNYDNLMLSTISRLNDLELDYTLK